jgi:hypothetical protein
VIGKEIPHTFLLLADKLSGSKAHSNRLGLVLIILQSSRVAAHPEQDAFPDLFRHWAYCCHIREVNRQSGCRTRNATAKDVFDIPSEKFNIVTPALTPERSGSARMLLDRKDGMGYQRKSNQAKHWQKTCQGPPAAEAV